MKNDPQSKNRDFRLYLWSDLVAQIAGVGAGLAIPVVTLRLSDSLTLAGLYGTITGIAALAGGIIGGSLADMWRLSLIHI